VPAEPAFWSLDSLRTGLAMVGVLAAVALGVAVWALLRDHNSRPAIVRSGPPPAQLAALTRQVQTLSVEVRSLRASTRAAAKDAAGAQRGVSELKTSARKTSARFAGTASTQQVSHLQTEVNKLSSQVAQLSSNQQSQTTTQTTTSTTSGG
jgi:outer membrane murein-binding lipoprotein Lpp